MLGIILSRRDFREFDQIISFYSKESGKREALARGVKKITSKNSGSLELFSLVEVEIISGKEIDHITKAQIINNFKNIRSNFIKMILATQAVVLVNNLTDIGEKDVGLFKTLAEWLKYINEETNPAKHLVSAFLWRLMYIFGLAPELNTCIQCGQKVSVSAEYFFDISSGGLLHSKCRILRIDLNSRPVLVSQAVVKALRESISESWSTINKIALKPKELAIFIKLVHTFAHYHTGHKISSLGVGV